MYTLVIPWSGGSGTLCESLLMKQAFHANVMFPNKHVDNPMEFHEGTNRLIETSTYEGARAMHLAGSACHFRTSQYLA
eukprot:2316162-Amphidinium_carterae.2